MRKILLICMVLTAATAKAQPAEKFQPLLGASVRPAGWIKTQMERNIEGFVGHLDLLVPTLMQDDIYGTERLKPNSKAKDLGNSKEGDAEGDEQYKWWNSETQSNWWDGYLRHVFLVGDQAGIEKARNYVSRILATQDADGYLGIYDPSLRYQFSAENGELWSKATLYRGLLAYYDYTKDEKVWSAIVRAVDNVMENYPINASQPFESGRGFNGGVSHGLTFTDVLDKMCQITHDRKYVLYAAFLYDNFCKTYQSEADVQLQNILDEHYKLRAHGVHTYEHLRPLIVAAYASGKPELQGALQSYLARIQQVTTITGGAIGDEWIAGRTADATHTGYEYCSLQELLDSYAVLLQKTGDPAIAESMERIFYNAAQGARHPTKSCIAYLKTDNSFEMLGTKNGEEEPDRKQTRYKYSPAHQDIAVCCNPNAGRITPYFVQYMWFKEGERTLVAALLGANVLQTSIQGVPIKIEQITSYPYQNSFKFNISSEKPLQFVLKIRKPEWAKAIYTQEKYREEGGFLIIERLFQTEESIKISFGAEVRVLQDAKGLYSFSYGALIFAKPIESVEQQGKMYAPGFSDLYYRPANTIRYAFVENHGAVYKKGRLMVKLQNEASKKLERVALIPLGKTILRQTSFH